MKTKVVFCTQVKQSKTGSRGYLRRIGERHYRIDQILHCASYITINNKKYVIMKLIFSHNGKESTQEIWVVPYE